MSDSQPLRRRQIVGSANADHCSPVSLHDGELLVETTSTPWAIQTRGLAPLFLRRVNAEMGHRTVVLIRVEGRRHRPGGSGIGTCLVEVPRDTYG